MLEHLSIQNYALIDRLEIDLNSGLTAITGETGSGKSIILGALGLVLGQRADLHTLRDENKKCIIEATFSVHKNRKKYFEENNLDYYPESIFRREITPSGKSRSFVNDTPVNLTFLKSLGKTLVDVHSQQENTLLRERDFQLDLVDSLANQEHLLFGYRNNFHDYKSLSEKVTELKEKELNAKNDFDYFNFQLNELESEDLEDKNIEELEEELSTCEHAEEIKGTLYAATEILSNSDQALVPSLKNIANSLMQVSSYNKSIADIETRLQSTLIELEDLSSEIEALGEDIEFDPLKRQELQEKLDKINQLLHKHRVSSVESLIEKRVELKNRIEDIDSLDEEIASLEKQRASVYLELQNQSNDLSKSRKLIIPQIEDSLHRVFKELGLVHAQLRISLEKSEELHPWGQDMISFDFRSNPGSAFQAIHKIASGGEQSRVMLAIKAVFSKSKTLPTIILDEIDNGVSGEVAKKVDKLMKKMSKYTQLLAMTHLPQIAGQAKDHLKVYKLSKADSTSTHIQSLNQKERIDELAEMLSGKAMSAAAKENARELLGVKD